MLFRQVSGFSRWNNVISTCERCAVYESGVNVTTPQGDCGLMEYVMSNDSNDIAKKILEDFDEQVERIEDEELTAWQRQRRRWLSGRMLMSSQIGSGYMFLKMTVGKKLAAWGAIKFPTLATLCSKLWAGLCGMAVGAWHFVFG